MTLLNICTSYHYVSHKANYDVCNKEQEIKVG